MKEKTSTNKTAQLSDTATATSAGEASGFANLATTLTEICKLQGIIGYILRSPTSAVIDLNEQEKISPYAVLSAQIQESSREMAKLFDLREMESVLVEGKDVKVLCMQSGENEICVFMEKSAAHAWVIKRIRLSTGKLSVADLSINQPS